MYEMVSIAYKYCTLQSIIYTLMLSLSHHATQTIDNVFNCKLCLCSTPQLCFPSMILQYPCMLDILVLCMQEKHSLIAVRNWLAQTWRDISPLAHSLQQTAHGPSVTIDSLPESQKSSHGCHSTSGATQVYVHHSGLSLMYSASYIYSYSWAYYIN